jgi:hypothetical protein
MLDRFAIQNIRCESRLEIRLESHLGLQAASHKLVASVPAHVKVVDLSADFRLKDIPTYEKWYNVPHGAPELQPGAVYGLCELNREALRGARLIANPGCYPTAAQLPLIPLLLKGLIQTDGIIIDAKSGTTGAGRAPKEGALYCEVADGIAAYGIASHRCGARVLRRARGCGKGARTRREMGRRLVWTGAHLIRRAPPHAPAGICPRSSKASPRPPARL